MVQHIAGSNEYVLDYFTDPFEIRDEIRYKDGSTRVHEFMFPYISQLLDLLITKKSSFTETALKKALKYNKETYKKLCDLIQSIKQSEHYSNDYMRDFWVNDCARELYFFENGNIVMFRTALIPHSPKGIITNVARTTVIPSSPVLKHLAEELNETYEKIKNLKDHLEEI